ncbi:MAG: endopeptidase La [Chloroflexi bacterium]|nr:endopeptidase La [Chloroflexota bacterium]
MLSALSDFEASHSAPLSDDGTFQAALIPLRDQVIFPNLVAPIFLDRPRSLEALSAAQRHSETLIGVMQRTPETENPTPDDLYTVGTEVALGRSLRMPDGTTSLVVQGRRRVQIEAFTLEDPYYRVRVRPLEDSEADKEEAEAYRRAVLTLFERVIQMSPLLPDEAYIYALNTEEPGWLADLVASTLDLMPDQRQRLLERINPIERLQSLSLLLGQELNLLQMEENIHAQVMHNVNEAQREMFLREQIRAIQTELGESDVFEQERTELQARVEAASMPGPVKDRAHKEIKRLAAMPPMAPEVGIIRTYLDVLLDLPWSDATDDKLDVEAAKEILDADHYGLKKAKERVLEFIAVRQMARDSMKSPILCFVGPPGTGKTSMGRSIARALGREFVRISLGGVRDEAEIRGHRRTYIGALPGRILQAMRRAGTVNPLFMLDEIDKIGSDYRGDPAAALLEVLDPEQNTAFSDNYLEVDYDLSQVLFVTTANTDARIPPALADRLEFIEFPGYIEEDKLEIARRFLIPKALKSHGLTERGLSFEEAALLALIRDHTYEAGVRNLERAINTICRKVVRRIAAGQTAPKRITPKAVGRYLGPGSAPHPILIEEDEVGIAQGVAWTEIGGEVFPVEVTLMEGKGNITLTGQLGEVMQESAQAAFSYLRSRADDYDLTAEQFEETDVHIHLPEGGIAKDGPSAGITLATALISAFTQMPVRHNVAMTGEITLRGRVLPVGGLKEKLLAAHRLHTLDTVIIPEANKRDLAELPAKVRRDLTIITAAWMDTVLKAALVEDSD